MNYDLQVTVDGYLSAPLADIVYSVSRAIGAYPGYTYHKTEIEPTATGDIIHIFYSDEFAVGAQVEVVPVIVYAILAVIAILGIVYITYELVVVAPQSPWGQVTIIAGVVTAVALLITAIKKRGD